MLQVLKGIQKISSERNILYTSQTVCNKMNTLVTH